MPVLSGEIQICTECQRKFQASLNTYFYKWKSRVIVFEPAWREKSIYTPKTKIQHTCVFIMFMKTCPLFKVKYTRAECRKYLVFAHQRRHFCVFQQSLFHDQSHQQARILARKLWVAITWTTFPILSICLLYVYTNKWPNDELTEDIG